MSKKLISIIIPVFNEEENIPKIHLELLNVFDAQKSKYNFEVIFVDDGSLDKSPEILEKLTKRNKNIKYIQFSRNFGKEIATSAGIHNAKGDAAIMIDADLQHPPKLIPKFIEKWEAGADIVVGVRKNNDCEAKFKRFCSFIYYKIMNRIGKTHITPNATDYRLIDKKVIKAFNRFTERDRITRGLLAWLGFKKEFIHFKTNPRESGKPTYSYLKLTKLAISSIVSHSLFPLKFAGYLGIIITPVFGILGLFILIEDVILKDPMGLNTTGTAMLGVLLIFLVGIILMSLGLIALYIAEIQSEVINRPMYVIRKTGNMNGTV